MERVARGGPAQKEYDAGGVINEGRIRRSKVTLEF